MSAIEANPAGTGHADVTSLVEVKGRAAESPSAQAASPSRQFLSLVPHEYARRHLILSEGTESLDGARAVERLITASTTRATAVHNVGVRLGRGTTCRVIDAESLARAIDLAYDSVNSTYNEQPVISVEAARDLEREMHEAVRESERDLLSTAGKAQPVRLVDLILFEALHLSASDVHVQPLRDRALVRYRLDGSLHTARELPASLASSVISRIKVMASLDVAERRAPQDGRAVVSIGSSNSERAGRRIDLRVSTLPSTFGERVVLRLLDPARSPHLSSFAALGMPGHVERAYLEQILRTSGVVLSTGPTGSGKTTTLYASLAWITGINTRAAMHDRGHDGPTSGAGSTQGCELNIMTIEDPVEYDLSGSHGQSGSALSVSQTQVDPRKNLTFATGLRHILRQDPDVIMVGEVRDQETARIAVQASLTGHLVLSTLHTNDAASAVARLLDLGVEPYLVASSLSAVLAQRLVRTLHAACKGAGCNDCFGTGFKGRLGVFELLVMDKSIRALIGQRASAVDMKAAARRAGMTTLAEAGGELVKRGLTTHEELTRVLDTHEEQWT